MWPLRELSGSCSMLLAGRFLLKKPNCWTRRKVSFSQKIGVISVKIIQHGYQSIALKKIYNFAFSSNKIKWRNSVRNCQKPAAVVSAIFWRFVVFRHFRPNASSDQNGLKRLLIEHFKSYWLMSNLIKFTKKWESYFDFFRKYGVHFG